MNQFRHLVRLFGPAFSPSQRLCLHRTAQDRKSRTDIHDLSGFQNHEYSMQAAKTHTLDPAATTTGTNLNI
jgi:hypothetical protein